MIEDIGASNPDLQWTVEVVPDGEFKGHYSVTVRHPRLNQPAWAQDRYEDRARTRALARLNTFAHWPKAYGVSTT